MCIGVMFLSMHVQSASVQLCIINIIKYNTNNSNNLNKLSLLGMQLPEHTRRILTFRAKTLCLEFIPTCESSMCVTVLNINKYCLFLKQDVTIMYESNPTAISPPPRATPGHLT